MYADCSLPYSNYNSITIRRLYTIGIHNLSMIHRYSGRGPYCDAVDDQKGMKVVRRVNWV